MRSVRVAVNETCPLPCRGVHPRRPHERASIAGGASIRAAIAAATDADELILTGGEPTLRGDLPALVAWARRHTDARIVLETHAVTWASGLAPALAEAGLSVVRVAVPAVGPPLDVEVGQADATASLRATVDALALLSIAVEGRVPVHAGNVALVGRLPSGLDEAGIVLDRLLVEWVDGDDRGVVPVPIDAFAAATGALAEDARAVGLVVQLHPAPHVPPCAFERPGRVAHLYALNPGAADRPGHTRVDACGSCQVADRCPGFPAGATPPTSVRPIEAPTLRRRLTVIRSVAEQIDRELVTHETYRREDGSVVPAAIVRVNFHCNQACEFCFVSTHLPAPPRDDVLAALTEIGGKGGIVALSGGEPTLHPELETFVRFARRAGVVEVELQTNATRLADPGRAVALEAAGVDVAFVSLHGATAATSDRVTGAPGTFARTVAGLDALASTAIRVRLNFVLCGYNHHEFPDFVDLVATQWPDAAINVSFVAGSTDLVPRTRELIVSYRAVMPNLEAGLARGRARGVIIGGFESMCGIPLCLVPGDLRRYAGLAAIAPGTDAGEFLKPAPCRECVLKTRCFGLRRGYAALHGTRELRPIRDPAPS